MSSILMLLSSQVLYIHLVFAQLCPVFTMDLAHRIADTITHRQLWNSTSVEENLTAPAEGLSWGPVIDRLVDDGYDRQAVTALFTRLESPPQPMFMAQKIVEIAQIRYGKNASLPVPPELAEVYAPPDYTRLAAGMSAAAGRAFINRHEKMFARIYKRYKVPASFIVAILMVETGIGANLGKNSALLTLGSMAATTSFSQVKHAVIGVEAYENAMQVVVREKSEWAYAELKALLDYAHSSGKDIVSMPSSVYGAIGLSQFMPSNIPIYGVDGNNDKTIDLFTLPDAAYSIASYLAAHGWANAQTPAAQLKVLRSYNHSDIYAATVYGVAMQFISPGSFAGGKGGNAVSTARKNAQSALPQGKARQGYAIPALRSYSLPPTQPNAPLPATGTTAPDAHTAVSP